MDFNVDVAFSKLITELQKAQPNPKKVLLLLRVVQMSLDLKGTMPKEWKTGANYLRFWLNRQTKRWFSEVTA